MFTGRRLTHHRTDLSSLGARTNDETKSSGLMSSSISTAPCWSQVSSCCWIACSSADDTHRALCCVGLTSGSRWIQAAPFIGESGGVSLQIGGDVELIMMSTQPPSISGHWRSPRRMLACSPSRAFMHHSPGLQNGLAGLPSVVGNYCFKEAKGQNAFWLPVASSQTVLASDHNHWVPSTSAVPTLCCHYRPSSEPNAVRQVGRHAGEVRNPSCLS